MRLAMYSRTVPGNTAQRWLLDLSRCAVNCRNFHHNEVCICNKINTLNRYVPYNNNQIKKNIKYLQNKQYKIKSKKC